MSAAGRPAATDEAVSVVIPCFDAAATLDACLAALPAGTVAPAEIIVVDDASGDASVTVAERRGATVLRQPERRGPAAARNRGLAAARHRWVLLVDADVVVEPEALARALGARSRWPDAGGIQGVYAREFGGTSLAGAYKHAQQWTNIAALPAGPTPVLGSSLALIDREAVLALGGFAEGVRGASVEDRLLGARLAAAGRPMVLAPEVVAQHRHDYGVGALLRADFRRARDEVAFGRELGAARGYVPTAVRLRYGLWAAGMALLVASPLGAYVGLAGAAALAFALALDAAAVARATGRLRPAWLALAVADHSAVVAGAALGMLRRRPAGAAAAIPRTDEVAT